VQHRDLQPSALRQLQCQVVPNLAVPAALVLLATTATTTNKNNNKMSIQNIKISP
jgi:hypothetical protein